MNEKQLADFGKTVRERREKLRLTRVALSDRAGITRTTLRALERGKQHPEPETIERLAKALQTTEHALTGQRVIEPDDPRLKNLTDEDIDVAQQFHHAPTRVKMRVLGDLQDAGGRTRLAAPVIEWAQRLLALDAEARQLVAHVIDAFTPPELDAKALLNKLTIDAKTTARAIERETNNLPRDDPKDPASRKRHEKKA